MNTKLQRICAWCKKDMDTGKQLTDDEYKILNKEATHGICPECSKKMAEPPPDAHKFSMNKKEAVDGVSGGDSLGKQLDLFSNSIAITKLQFCHACLDHFMTVEMGKDSRYCKGCEAFLLDEWALMQSRSVKIKPGWVPRLNGEAHHDRRKKNGSNGHATLVGELPIKKIKAMAVKGMSSKRIAAELINKGYTVNYRTIAKMVKGSGRNDRTGQGTKAKRLPTSSSA